MIPLLSSVLFILYVSLVFCADSHGQEAVCVESWIRQAEELLHQTGSYTALFHKQERIKDFLKSKETVYLRFKKPFKVHMTWVDGPGKGREIFYVEGWNKNRILVREPGAWGIATLNLNPFGSLAMQGSRHPITEIGLENLIRLLGEDFRKGWRLGELEVRMGKEELLYGRKTIPIEARFPKEPRTHYYCFRSLLNLDFETKIPIRVQIFDWESRLIGDYGYENLRLNAGLTDADFDPRNRR